MTRHDDIPFDNICSRCLKENWEDTQYCKDCEKFLEIGIKLQGVINHLNGEVN